MEGWKDGREEGRKGGRVDGWKGGWCTKGEGLEYWILARLVMR